ncbi:hypothetical protein GCM10023165_16790 [Variovorax defluvii]|uniref:Uncharacterized protein n=1 Tax=Variovorax defluvii TaxID=913761 RepID=A0ABP8HFI0_9BURK
MIRILWKFSMPECISHGYPRRACVVDLVCRADTIVQGTALLPTPRPCVGQRRTGVWGEGRSGGLVLRRPSPPSRHVVRGRIDRIDGIAGAPGAAQRRGKRLSIIRPRLVISVTIAGNCS